MTEVLDNLPSGPSPRRRLKRRLPAFSAQKALLMPHLSKSHFSLEVFLLVPPPGSELRSLLGWHSPLYLLHRGSHYPGGTVCSGLWLP